MSGGGGIGHPLRSEDGSGLSAGGLGRCTCLSFLFFLFSELPVQLRTLVKRTRVEFDAFNGSLRASKLLTLAVFNLSIRDHLRL